eukprot:g17719.t1
MRKVSCPCRRRGGADTNGGQEDPNAAKKSRLELWEHDDLNVLSEILAPVGNDVLARREWCNKRDACERQGGVQEFGFENIIYVQKNGKWQSRVWIGHGVIGLGDLFDSIRSGNDPVIENHAPWDRSVPITTCASLVVMGFEDPHVGRGHSEGEDPSVGLDYLIEGMAADGIVVEGFVCNRCAPHVGCGHTEGDETLRSLHDHLAGDDAAGEGLDLKPEVLQALKGLNPEAVANLMRQSQAEDSRSLKGVPTPVKSKKAAHSSPVAAAVSEGRRPDAHSQAFAAEGTQQSFAADEEFDSDEGLPPTYPGAGDLVITKQPYSFLNPDAHATFVAKGLVDKHAFPADDVLLVAHQELTAVRIEKMAELGGLSKRGKEFLDKTPTKKSYMAYESKLPTEDMLKGLLRDVNVSAACRYFQNEILDKARGGSVEMSKKKTKEVINAIGCVIREWKIPDFQKKPIKKELKHVSHLCKNLKAMKKLLVPFLATQDIAMPGDEDSSDVSDDDDE